MLSYWETYQVASDVERGRLGVNEESSGILGASKSHVDLITGALEEDLDQSSVSNGSGDLGVGDASRREKDNGVVDVFTGNEIIDGFRGHVGASLAQEGIEALHVEAIPITQVAVDVEVKLTDLCCEFDVNFGFVAYSKIQSFD
jgi:hypothetical protein